MSRWPCGADPPTDIAPCRRRRDDHCAPTKTGTETGTKMSKYDLAQSDVFHESPANSQVADPPKASHKPEGRGLESAIRSVRRRASKVLRTG